MKERFDHVLGHNVRREMELHRGRANEGEEFKEDDFQQSPIGIQG